MNVYECLKAYLDRSRAKEIYKCNTLMNKYSVQRSLLHDAAVKIGCYKMGTRTSRMNTECGKRSLYIILTIRCPMDMGEKSVYIISGFMRLTREEAFAIRFHMGFSGPEDKGSIGKAFEKFPLAFALSVADMEATDILEGKNKIDCGFSLMICLLHLPLLTG